jgi:hypothetical protein
LGNGTRAPLLAPPRRWYPPRRSGRGARTAAGASTWARTRAMMTRPCSPRAAGRCVDTGLVNHFVTRTMPMFVVCAVGRNTAGSYRVSNRALTSRSPRPRLPTRSARTDLSGVDTTDLSKIVRNFLRVGLFSRTKKRVCRLLICSADAVEGNAAGSYEYRASNRALTLRSPRLHLRSARTDSPSFTLQTHSKRLTHSITHHSHNAKHLFGHAPCCTQRIL